LKPFASRLAAAVRRCGNPVVVGLDPRRQSLPAPLQPVSEDQVTVADSYRNFCQAVIDVVAPLVPAVKPQSAFFEQLGPAGLDALAQTIRYAREKELLVILDGKRNDIGSTAMAYAQGYLAGPASPWQADALTVSPYLGDESLQPFLQTAVASGTGIFVLVKTSNPGGGMFQDLPVHDLPLYHHVAKHVESLAAESVDTSGYGVAGAVVGATYPEQLTEMRRVMPHAWILVPGFGSQGATARDVAGAFAPDGLGAVVNSSRGIIFAHSLPEYRDQFGDHRWQEAVEAATRKMIEELRSATSAGQL